MSKMQLIAPYDSEYAALKAQNQHKMEISDFVTLRLLTMETCVRVFSTNI